MFKWVAVGVGAILVGGCAVPVPFQIASWALDGISMLTTQKSVTDHGISLVTQQDCAVWRGVTEGELCRDVVPEQGDVLVAEEGVNPQTADGLDSASGLSARADSQRSAPVISQTPSNQSFQVRSVPTHALRAAWTESGRNPVVTSPIVRASFNTHALRALPVKRVTLTPAQVKKVPSSVALAALSQPVVKKSRSLPKAHSDGPARGIYFVIGSFRNPANARRLVDGNDKLAPAVLSARLDGTDVYRVVVGPVPRGREKRLHRALARDGFPDTWAIRINPSDWQFAKLPMPLSKASPEVATLQK